MFAQFALILALGLGLASAAVLGEGECQIDKDFVLLKGIAKLDARVSKLEEGSGQCAKCKDGWVTFQGACYQFLDDSRISRTWKQATEYCHNLDAQLLVISNKSEDLFVRDTLNRLFKGETGRSTGFWFGADDEDQDGHWEWYDSHLHIDVTYSNWYPGQGDENPYHEENCGCLWNQDKTGFNWHDCPCDKPLKNLICEQH